MTVFVNDILSTDDCGPARRHLLMPRTRFARTEYPGYAEFRRKISAADKAQVVLVKTES
ncbi:hypothetical protein [Hymenobacter gelipurpurascens]|uniref:hypothetical protein n=1 Tax=Hymenobacter gelipurpurascens TaxID=89968 RepID=UPI00148270E3|nr:hypothetical protein [Hymenobacter gelipurpurascens]